MIVPMLIWIAFIFVLIASIFAIIRCPYNIFTHLPLCTYYWFLDVLFTIIWFFFWILSFVLLYLPIWIIFSIICLFYKPLCIDIKIDDVCIKRLDFFKVVDYIFHMVFEKRLLNRINKDIDNCYCSKSLKGLFKPLINFKYPSLNDYGKGESSNSMFALVVAFVILLILYSKNSKQDETSAASS